MIKCSILDGDKVVQTGVGTTHQEAATEAAIGLEGMKGLMWEFERYEVRKERWAPPPVTQKWIDEMKEEIRQ